MSVLIKENDLPQELTAEQAVEAAYSSACFANALSSHLADRAKEGPLERFPAA